MEEKKYPTYGAGKPVPKSGNLPGEMAGRRHQRPLKQGGCRREVWVGRVSFVGFPLLPVFIPYPLSPR